MLLGWGSAEGAGSGLGSGEAGCGIVLGWRYDVGVDIEMTS